ncbi:MAG: T9SS type A sorting domain-containing protein [Bacteroidales bacterium]|nr:T9SS type A sorting domain-containing protein [Bacteroidales bacterium]
MKKLSIILIVSLFTIVSIAQPWSVTPTDYEFSMNVIGQVSIDNNIVNQQASFIGAFVDDICVGVCSPVEDAGEHKLFYLTIYSNLSSGDNIEFKFVDQTDAETLISNTIVFVSDGIIGDSQAPFVWFDVELYASTDILSFSFEEQVSAAEINTTTHTVNISVENGTVLSNLVPEFVLSPGAIASINSLEQVSGVTANDYSSDVIYLVTGADAASTNWTISVTTNGSNVAEFNSDVVSIYPNPASDYLYIISEHNNLEHIKIIDVQGRIIKKSNIINGMVDIAFLDSGIYFVEFLQDNLLVYYKFIKK